MTELYFSASNFSVGTTPAPANLDHTGDYSTIVFTDQMILPPPVASNFEVLDTSNGNDSYVAGCSIPVRFKDSIAN
jgi:hypothetical protein